MILKAKFPERCIGCEMCVFEAQRQLGKVGLENSPIRIMHREGESFSVHIDPEANELDIEKIKSICPTLVFTIEEANEEFSN